jgi:hypothetical protein
MPRNEPVPHRPFGAGRGSRRKKRRLSNEEVAWEKALDSYVREGILDRRPPPCGNKHPGSWWVDGRVWKCRLCHPPAGVPELPRF